MTTATRDSFKGSTLFWKTLPILLSHLKHGHLRIHYNDKMMEFGDKQSEGPHAEVMIHNLRVVREMVTGGAMSASEGYINGDWDSPNLTHVIRLFAANLDNNSAAPNSMKKWLRSAAHWLNQNTISGSKRNIQAHYDLGNELFESFLDPSMMYSSAIFPSEKASLEEAQQYRLERICQKLHLGPENHLVEIGTGWGSLAIYAAKNFGCRVTTTTISDEQFAFAKNKIEQAGLTDRITLLKEDYRKLEGQFDRLVSIEMIEAVGHKFLPGYFNKIDKLLSEDGIALLQCITIPDQRYKAYRRSSDFIRKYIFPGGHLPSISEVHQQIAQQTNMTVKHFEDITEHYARTIFEWNERFIQNFNSLPQKKYDRTFYRIWRYYFAFCEGGFRERAIGTSQVVFSKTKANQNWLHTPS